MNCQCSDPMCRIDGCKAARAGGMIVKTGPFHQMVGSYWALGSPLADAAKESPKRRGRPRKNPGERSIPFTFTTNNDLHDSIRAAAKASGRSISGEIEYRLERSFRDDDAAEAIWSRLAEREW